MENTFYLSFVCIILSFSFLNIFYCCVFMLLGLTFLFFIVVVCFMCCVCVFCLVDATGHRNKKKKSPYVQITCR